jgi:hypothetical protein
MHTATPELNEARQFASAAHLAALVTLIVLGINIGFRLGAPAWAAIAGEDTWRENVHDVGLVLIALMPAMFFFEAVNQLRVALKHFCAGEFYHHATATRVARAGDYAISGMVALIAVVPNLTSWVNHEGGFRLNFESEYIGMTAFALFVAAVGRILSAATQLKAENDSFV